MKKILVYVGIFAAIFFLTLFTHPFYQAQVINLNGNCDSESELIVKLNTGRGFNDYEQINVKVKCANNNFNVDIDLPKVKIEAIRIQFVDEKLRTEKVLINKNITSFKNISNSILLKDFSNKIRFDTKVLVLKVIISLLISSVLINLYLIYIKYKFLIKEDIKNNFKSYKLSIYILIGSLIIYSVWLIAFWPGATSNDSYATLSEIQNLQLNDWHPYIYSIYLLALMSIWNGVEAIAIFQILVTSITGTFIFYYCMCKKVNKYYLLPFIILFITSIPIGNYNLILWKDIPFSLAILIFSLLIFVLGIKKAEVNNYLSLDSLFILPLMLLISALLHMRHNGILLGIMAPILLMHFFNFKSKIKILKYFLLTILCLFIVLPKILNIKMTSGAPLYELKTALQIMNHFNFYSKDRERDIKIVEDASGLNWGQIKESFPEKYFTKVWDQSKFVTQGLQFLEGGGYTEQYNKKFLLRIVSDNLPIYFGEKTFELFHSIGLDSSTYDKYTNFYEDPLQLLGSNLAPPGRFLYGVSVESKPPSIELYQLMARLDNFSRSYNGIISIQTIVWNLLMYILIAIVLLIKEPGSSPINFYIYPSILSAIMVFLPGAGESWRYFYNIYLCGIFLIPIYLVQIKNIKVNITSK